MNDMELHDWVVQFTAIPDTISGSPHHGVDVRTRSCTLMISDIVCHWDKHTVSTVLDSTWLDEFRNRDTEQLRSMVGQQRKWVNRVSIVRSGGMLSIGCTFQVVVLFPSLHQTVLGHSILARHIWSCLGFFHLHILNKGRLYYAARRIHWKAIVWCQSVTQHMSLYKYLPSKIA